MAWENNPSWFSIETRPEADKKEELSTKVYATLPVQEYTFIQNILSLAKKFRELSLRTDDNVKVKFPQNLAVFIAKSDSLVIHFKNKNNLGEVQNILREWLESCALHESERELGQTKIATDPKETSFTDLITQNISHWMIEQVDSYDIDVVVREGIKHAIQQAQTQPKV